eukprot:jgi/Psemu1/301276/fgenesh1_kg.29_\
MSRRPFPPLSATIVGPPTNTTRTRRPVESLPAPTASRRPKHLSTPQRKNWTTTRARTWRFKTTTDC